MMKRWIQGIAGLVLASAIMGCGGGAGSGDPLPGTNPGTPTGPAASSIEVLANSNSVGSSGSETVTVTAIVKDASNNGLASTAVSFSTDTGTLSGASATTDAAGVATATFNVGSNRSNRTATVTVRSGAVTGTVAIDIVNTKLAYSGATTFPLGATPTLTVSATDSSGNPIAGASIAVTSSAGNGLASTSITTNASGQAAVQYTATNPGADTVTFNGAGASATAVLTISGEDFRFTTPSATATTNVQVGASQPLTVTYRQNGSPQAGVVVSFAATIGSLSAPTATTNASGQASVSISSTFAGSSIVTATLPGGVAQATVPLQFIATLPSKIVVQISPTAVAPNAAGSTTNQATVSARVTDASDNPVTGVTVNFSQQQDVSGGSLSQASSVTDTNGQASVKYIAGANSTASGGVVISATVASNTTIADTASLTVSQSALFIALGTGNTIENIDPQTYKKDWTVYVTDANGVAVPGVTVTMKALPQNYLKGTLVWSGTAWEYSSLVISCANEDADFDGVLDSGEDFNANGTLEPGNVISVSPGTLTTDSSGRATLSLIYAESYAPWVRIKLQAQAIVSGTASSTSSVFIVNGSSEDFSEEEVPPAGRLSPFGTATSCANSN